MARRRRRFLLKLLPMLFVFGLGVAVGFYVRDNQQHKKIERAVEQARREMEQAVEAGRRAGEDLQASVRAAKVAAESTKAAIRGITGDSAGR